MWACVLYDIDLVRPLRMARIPCILITDPRTLGCYSRYSKVVLEGALYFENGENLVEPLVRFGVHSQKPVLFYVSDSQLLFISRFRERLRRAFRFVIADPTLVEDLVDKSRFLTLADRLDLPVPQTQLVRPNECTATPGLNVRFPIIIKPLNREIQRQGWRLIGGSRKALQVNTPAEFAKLWPVLAETGIGFLAQELIPGPETRIESYHVYVDESGEIRAEFTGRKIRTYPVAQGDSTALVITDSAEVAAMGRSLVQRLNLRGVAKFDFKRGSDGSLHLLEINPRFNLWHYLGAAAGVNIPALVYADLMGQQRSMISKAKPGVRWCRIENDLMAARTLGVPLSAWIYSVLRCEAKSGFGWDDPIPFLHQVTRLDILKGILRGE